MTRFLTIVMIATTVCGSAQDWHISEVAEGRKPSIAIDQQGRLHMVFLDRSNSTVRHALIRDTTNIEVSVVRGEGSFEGPAAIGIDFEGRPNIAIHDHRSENEAIFTLIGTEWSEEQVFSLNHDGWDNSLDYDSQGNLYTVSTDFVDGVEISSRDTSGMWQRETLPTGAVFYNGSTTLIIDELDSLHISYHNPNQNKKNIEYAYRSDGQWIIEEVDPNGIFPDMAIDTSGRLNMAYLSQLTETTYHLKLAIREDGVWSTSVLDTLQHMGSIAKRTTSIKIDPEDTRHISYGDRRVVKYAREFRGEWSLDTITTHDGSPGILGALTDLALDRRGNPIVTYYTVQDDIYVARRNFRGELVDEDRDGYDSSIDCDDTDPFINPGATEILDNGIDENCDGLVEMSEQTPVEGIISDRFGVGIANVKISSSNGSFPTLYTNEFGQYKIPNISQPTMITFSKEDSNTNGVTVSDIILIRNHILGLAMLNENAFFAADVNRNGDLGVTDAVIIRNVILNPALGFPSGESWMFEPNNFIVNPASVEDIINVKGIKCGDVSGDADPRSN